MGYWVVCYVTAVQADGLAVEEVGERFIGRGGIAEGPGCQGQPSDKVIIELAIDTKPHTNSGAVAIKESRLVLEKAFTTDADIAIKAEASQ